MSLCLLYWKCGWFCKPSIVDADSYQQAEISSGCKNKNRQLAILCFLSIFHFFWAFKGSTSEAVKGKKHNTLNIELIKKASVELVHHWKSLEITCLSFVCISLSVHQPLRLSDISYGPLHNTWWHRCFTCHLLILITAAQVGNKLSFEWIVHNQIMVKYNTCTVLPVS